MAQRSLLEIAFPAAFVALPILAIFDVRWMEGPVRVAHRQNPLN
jgi:hypothetical protein